MLTAARFIADALGRPLASKVGQAGGWDPTTGAADRRADRDPHAPARSDVLLSSGHMDGVVLVLNQNYEPLNVCNLPRAFRLVFGEKAEVIEYDHQVIRTPRTEYRAPSVIRLQYLIRRPRPRVKLSRREVFARDRHTCQYCGRQAHDMTLDHVMPRHRGGGHTWENLVTACKPCNHRKGGKTLEEARLHLLRSRSSRAATSTRCSRRTSPTRTTRRGGPTCSWAATDGPDRGAGSHRGRDPRRRHRRAPELWANGHAAYVVGGSLRDVVLGRRPEDWDLAPGALPGAVVALFPDAVYENRFGTVAVRARRRDLRDHDLPDRPRLRRLPATAPGRVR